MAKIKLLVTYEYDSNDTVQVSVNGLPIHSYGDTIEEARERIKDAILSYTDSCKKHKDLLPLGIDIIEVDTDA